MEWHDDGIRVTDDPTAVDLEVVHGFLSEACRGLRRDAAELYGG